jgi:hypothetical protein
MVGELIAARKEYEKNIKGMPLTPKERVLFEAGFAFGRRSVRNELQAVIDKQVAARLERQMENVSEE